MRRALPVLTSPVVPVAAATPCLELIEQLEAVLERAELEPRQDDVALETKDGPVVVSAPDSGVPPQENWFGDPAAREVAAQGLIEARAKADAGDEGGCTARVRQVEALIDGADR